MAKRIRGLGAGSSDGSRKPTLKSSLAEALAKKAQSLSAGPNQSNALAASRIASTRISNMTITTSANPNRDVLLVGSPLDEKEFTMTWGSAPGAFVEIVFSKVANTGVDPAVAAEAKQREEIAAMSTENLKQRLFDTYRERDRARDELAKCDSNIKNLQGKVQELSKFISQIKQQPTPFATVLKTSSTRTVISVAGKIIEVQTTVPVKPGQSVKCSAETMQNVEAVDDDGLTFGEVVPVVEVVRTGLCKIERAGSKRAVGFSGFCEEGDLVVLDQTGAVVVENLGKPKNELEFTQSTGVTWDDIGGLVEAKAQMIEAIEGPVRHKDVFAKFGKKPVRGILLYGPPGCGKTLLGKAAATAVAKIHGAKSAGGFMYVKGPELLNMYVGNTESNIRKMFDDARRYKKKHGYPALIFLDEADAILGARGGQGFGMERTTVPQFLSEMDGLEDSGAIVIIATNRPETLDAAIVRDGRIDRRIRVARPTERDAQKIFELNLRGRPLARGASVDELAIIAAGELFSPEYVVVEAAVKGLARPVQLTLAHTVNGAMIAGVVDRATSYAMQRLILGGSESDSGIGDDDLIRAVQSSHSESLDVNHDEEITDLVEQMKLEQRSNGSPSASANTNGTTQAAASAA